MGGKIIYLVFLTGPMYSLFLSLMLTFFTAKEMHAEVYAVEPLETRHLHQVVTPPMSDAAREAREAFKSRAQEVDEDYLDY